MSVHGNQTDAPKLTKNQSLVFGVLSHATAPLTAYELLDSLRDEGLRAPLQIYRALEKLQEKGLVHRLESINAFVLCQHQTCCPQHKTAAFAICSDCGYAKEFVPDEALDKIKNFVCDAGFKTEKITIELRGYCKNCQEKTTLSAPEGACKN